MSSVAETHCESEMYHYTPETHATDLEAMSHTQLGTTRVPQAEAPRPRPLTLVGDAHAQGRCAR